MPANQVSADYAVVIAREAQKRGTDLLFNTPFTLKVLEQLEFVPLEPFIELLARFTELYQDPEWGFELGKKLSMFSHGPLGFGAVSAPTIGEGLAFFARFISTRADYLRGTFEADAQKATLKLTFKPYILAHRQRMSETLSIIIEELVSSSGGNAAVLNWCFPSDSHNQIMVYRRWLKGNFDFRDECFQVTIPTEISNTASSFYNLAAYQTALNQCERLNQRPETEQFTTLVSELLERRSRRRLAETVAVTTLPSAAETASLVGCSPRQLFRRLKAENTTFKQIKDEIIRSCLVDLAAQNLSVSEISDILGFSDVGNFNRACKRLLGMTPGQLIRSKNPISSASAPR